MNPLQAVFNLGNNLLSIPIHTYIGTCSISQICSYALMVALVGYIVSKLF